MIDTNNDTIAAPSTGEGGAIAVIRVSGPDALRVCDAVFTPVSGVPLTDAKGYTLHYGTIRNGGEVVDDVIVSVFRAPRSYTGEDMAEISCHGSTYIRNAIMALLADNGVRPAGAGEFTMRAFMAGKMDLSQAEAVADIIASQDRASHAVAMNQMKGGYSEDLRKLRDELLGLASLLELELDFSEEDVEFADRARLVSLVNDIAAKIELLKESFLLNNSIKEGVPVTIAGEPNTGKSTLLNALLREDRAMVSDIAGTTRDVIEESVVIDGVRFRFTDTAGLRDTDDRLENMGIERARRSIAVSKVLLYVAAPGMDGNYSTDKISRAVCALDYSEGTIVYLLLNKCDTLETVPPDSDRLLKDINCSVTMDGSGKKIDSAFLLSAKKGEGLDELRAALSAVVDREHILSGSTIVTNARHYEALLRSGEALQRAKEGLGTGISADLLAEDIRDSVYHLGTITGEITNDEILGSIFSKFCIGK